MTVLSAGDKGGTVKGLEGFCFPGASQYPLNTIQAPQHGRRVFLDLGPCSLSGLKFLSLCPGIF